MDLFWVHLPKERVTTQRRKEGRKEGRRELEGERERRKEGERGRKWERRNSYREGRRKRSTQYALKLTTVSSLELIQESVSRCLLHTLLTSYFGNHGLWPEANSPLWRDQCRAIGGWMGGEGRVGVPVERGKQYRVRGAGAPLGGRIRSVSAAEWGEEGWLCLYKRCSLHSICPQSCDGL